MPTQCCRDSVVTKMAAAYDKLSTSSPRKGRSAKRKLLEDDLSQSPAKRTRSKTNPDSPLRVSQSAVSKLTPPPEKVAARSFYGGARSKYISPLERKEQRENSEQRESTPFASPAPPPPVLSIPKQASPLVSKQARKSIARKSKDVKQPAKQKSFMQKERNIVINPVKATESRPSTPGTDKEELNESTESVPQTPESADNKPKKFFKNRVSPGESDQARGPRVVLRKGFKLTYHRAGVKTNAAACKADTAIDSNAKSDRNAKMLPSLVKKKLQTTPNASPRLGKVTYVSNPLSQDMFSDTSDYSAWFDDEATDSENQIITRSKSPVKKLTTRSPCPSPLRERNRKLDQVSLSQISSSPDSAKADSVMLLSDICSHDGTPTASPYNQKRLFSIFNPKVSPVPKAIVSSATSSPQSSAPASPQSQSSLSVKTRSGQRSSKHVLRSLRDRDGKEQMILDFGQKLGTAIQCGTCGMTYTEGEPSDEATHSKFHQNILSVLKFPGWKKERICQDNPDGSRIIVITSEDRFATKKIDAVRNIVDTELGFVVERRKLVPGMKTFLYISEDKQIIGCCIAQEIKKGYRVLSDSQSEGSQQSPGRPWCCSIKPEPAKCGISRIWVLASQRGRKIASQLIDCVRFHFLLGYPLKKEELAFSDPTPDGRSFATSYMENPCFLVYKQGGFSSSQ